MRTIRAMIIAALAALPMAIIGLFVWWMMGSSKDNTSLAVVIPCNIIPLAGMIVIFLMAWQSGEEYAAVKGDDEAMKRVEKAARVLEILESLYPGNPHTSRPRDLISIAYCGPDECTNYGQKSEQ